jgi:phosphoserine phosphatase
MRIALFDLDHTLLPHDTQTLFCNFVLKRAPWRLLLHGLFLPFALLRALGLCSTATAKRAFNSYLWGMPISRLKKHAHDFAHDCVNSWIYPELRAELLRHRHQGRAVILNTASPSFYAQAIAQALEFDHYIATPVILDGHRFPFLPRIDGENNKRQAKIDRMETAIPSLKQRSAADIADSWGFSDSAADIPLLEYCGRRILVHPSNALIAHFKNDPKAVILQPKRPYSTKLGDMLHACLQVIGLHPEKGPN